MTDFSSRIAAAANIYSKQCRAYAHFQNEANGDFGVHVRAIEIVKQFTGNIDYLKDPKGLLFYNEEGDFGHTDLVASFEYTRTDESDNYVSIQVDFTIVGGTPKKPFAAFIAGFNANDYDIPTDASRHGKGHWTSYKGALAEGDVTRGPHLATIHLEFPALMKKVHFNASSVGKIVSPGVLLFDNYKALTDVPDECTGDKMQVDYAPEHIVFYAGKHGRPHTIYAVGRPSALQFIPNSKMKIDANHRGPYVTWEDM